LALYTATVYACSDSSIRQCAC